MYIRTATPEDLDFIVAANIALAAETECQTLDPQLIRTGVATVLGDPALGRYYLAELAGRVVGQLMTTRPAQRQGTGRVREARPAPFQLRCHGSGLPGTGVARGALKC
jgi:hypothetical protein